MLFFQEYRVIIRQSTGRISHKKGLFGYQRTNAGAYSYKIVSISPVYIVRRIGKVLIKWRAQVCKKNEY